MECTCPSEQGKNYGQSWDIDSTTGALSCRRCKGSPTVAQREVLKREWPEFEDEIKDLQAQGRL